MAQYINTRAWVVPMILLMGVMGALGGAIGGFDSATFGEGRYFGHGSAWYCGQPTTNADGSRGCEWWAISRSAATMTTLFYSGIYAVGLAGIGWVLITVGGPRQSTEKPAVQPVYSLLRITVPPIPWEPTQAVGLMTALYPLTPLGQFIFRIIATNTRIIWELIVPQEAAAAVNRDILSYYPHADIDSTDYERDVRPEASLVWRGGLEYFAPLSFAEDLTTLDPLTSIVGAMAQLKDGERVVYSLTIEPTQLDYRKEGYKKIHHSKAPMLLSMAAAAAGSKPIVHVGQKSLDKYEARYQNAFEEKLSSALLPAQASIDVYTPDSQRFISIRDGISTATTAFDRPNANNLTSNPKGLPLILSPQEAATLWHLPSDHIQTAA